MSKELTEKVSEDIINSLILTGDMSKLTSTQQTQYYGAVCNSLGLNPLIQPFSIIVLQGKKILYANKVASQQLSDLRKINTEIKKKEILDGIYIVECRASLPDGRYTDEIGVVSISNLKGIELANAMMKAVTKAKRRAVLSLCGLGMSDESEIEDIKNDSVTDVKVDNSKSRLENIIEQTKDKPIVEDAQIVSVQDEPIKKKKTKNENKNNEHSVNLFVEGVIEGQPRSGIVEGKGTKYLFRIKGNEYGTFDEKIIKEMMDIVDMQQKKPENKFLVRIEYKERESEKTKGKFFYDILSFKQMSTEDIDIPI